jgi:hypothetical protein
MLRSPSPRLEGERRLHHQFSTTVNCSLLHVSHADLFDDLGQPNLHLWSKQNENIALIFR